MELLDLLPQRLILTDYTLHAQQSLLVGPILVLYQGILELHEIPVLIERILLNSIFLIIRTLPRLITLISNGRAGRVPLGIFRLSLFLDFFLRPRVDLRILVCPSEQVTQRRWRRRPLQVQLEHLIALEQVLRPYRCPGRMLRAALWHSCRRHCRQYAQCL